MKKSFLISVLCLNILACGSAKKNFDIGQVVYPKSVIRLPACGGNEVGKLEVLGDLELAKILRKIKLICKVGDLHTEGNIGEYAKYRCINSPSYLSLETYGQSRVIKSIQGNQDGSVLLVSEQVSNKSVDQGFPEAFRQEENITCFPSEIFSGDKKAVLKMSDFKCQETVHKKLYSKFISAYHAEKKALKLPDVPNDFTFDINELNPGTFLASNLKIDNKSFTGSGEAKVEATDDGCKVIEIKASIK